MTAPVSPDASRLRLTILLIVVGCLFVALLARLWFLQVINASAASKQVESSGVVTVYTPAPRGEIIDRDGRVLVTNRDVPVIEVQRGDIEGTGAVPRLAALLGESVKTLTAAIDNVQYTSLQPVPVFSGASAAQILYVQEHQSIFPGVTATTETVPWVTPLGEYAADIIGYVSRIDPTELAALDKKGGDYQPNDLIGQTGVEYQFESVLRGRPGVKKIQVNSQGQPLAVLSSTPPVPGLDVRLSIDADVQKVAVEAIQGGETAARRTFDPVTNRLFAAPGGSVVALDPNNGQVLAMATDPSYNPNQFNNGGISDANYAALADNPADPLENRAMQGQYAPGSTFKLVTATAGLRYGLITPTSYYDDIGHITIGGQTFTDDDGEGAGEIQLPTAITVSSDNYFNQIGIDFWNGRATYGQTALQKVADGYGFNSPTGIDLPNESSGVIPTPALYAEQYKEYPGDFASPGWYTGDSAITAIGQGEVLVTPLQLANAYAAFANGGTLYHPQVALDAQTAAGKVVVRYGASVLGHSPTLTPADRAAMLQGFIGVVNNSSGTAYEDFAGNSVAAGALDSEDIAGKTGTAQVTGAGKQNTSVFTSFAPAAAPQYVVDCFMEDSGYGASVAAPVVREVYDQIFGKPLQPVSYAAATGNAT